MHVILVPIKLDTYFEIFFIMLGVGNNLILPAFHCFCNIFLLVIRIFQITLLLEW
jgi:hypothetical protein